jgi:hypothetical protein
MYQNILKDIFYDIIKLIKGVFGGLIHGVTGLGINDKAEYIGTFVIIYLSLGGGFIFMCIVLGINPTLVMSVISAPIWIFIVYVSNQITKQVIKSRKKRGK